MDGILVKATADEVARRIRGSGIPPVTAVAAVFKEQHGGKGWDDEFRRAVLAELGRRGGKKAARVKKTKKARDSFLKEKMIREAQHLAFQRKDHLVPDLY